MGTGLACRCGLVVVACAGLCLSAGCDSNHHFEDDAPWFTGEYIDPSGPAGSVRLRISEDGTFTMVLCARGAQGAVDVEDEIGHGSWTSLGDGVELDGGTWRASLSSDDVPVFLAGRADTLAGLRWTTVSGSGPVESGRFMLYREFAEFVHPPGGFGTSTGGM